MKDVRYTVTSVEVKTRYNITIGLVQMCETLAIAKRNESLMEAYQAFEGVDLNVGHMRAIQIMRDLWNPAADRKATRTIDFIVCEVLGFDGVENYGFFSEDKLQARLTVYRNGGQINK